jgi:hypothetical protein
MKIYRRIGELEKVAAKLSDQVTTGLTKRQEAFVTQFNEKNKGTELERKSALRQNNENRETEISQINI